MRLSAVAALAAAGVFVVGTAWRCRAPSLLPLLVAAWRRRAGSLRGPLRAVRRCLRPAPTRLSTLLR